jgi:GcrA cell cycle regulator
MSSVLKSLRITATLKCWSYTVPIQSQWKNEDRLNEAIALWKKGVTAQQGADILGVSRSAFLGIIHRLKKQNVVQGRHTQGIVGKSPKRRRVWNPAPQIKGSSAQVPNCSVRKSPYVETISLEDSLRGSASLKTLANLGDDDCRWPIGDPQSPSFGFCARPRLPGTSYCPDHRRRSVDQPVVVASRDVEPITEPLETPVRVSEPA